VEGQGNVNIGGCFLEVNATTSHISTHPLVWPQSKIQHPWALFHKTTVDAQELLGFLSDSINW